MKRKSFRIVWEAAGLPVAQVPNIPYFIAQSALQVGHRTLHDAGVSEAAGIHAVFTHAEYVMSLFPNLQLN